MIGRPFRIITNILAGVFLVQFLVFLTFFMLGFFGAPFLEEVSDFFMEDPMGWALIMFVGFIALLFSILMVAFWTMDMRWKDLRYKMIFFLYHSKVKYNERIPLQYLARVGVCDTEQITQVLENMIARGELKGIVDREEGVYIHKGLTRRGMKVLIALPPAGMTGLKEVKKWALKGHTWEDEEGEGDIEDLEELEEVDEVEELEEVEEQDMVGELLKKKDKHKIRCPHCGRMNIKDHQFCTFCGEVI
ncbi:MAG: PCI domain-containing protein [Thermoplasmatota archaeon]